MNDQLSDIVFPVICFWKGLIRVRNSLDSLTTTTKAGLKNGYFSNLLIVDSDGRAIRVGSAHKVNGVGWFFGYNIFLNQRIRVALEISERPFTISLDEVKGMVQSSFQSWHGWATRGDFEELKQSIKDAESISQIIGLLSEK